MKFFYLTFKKYPSKTADAYYVKSLAHAFADILQDAFSLIVLKGDDRALEGIPHKNLYFKAPKLRPLRYLLWIPVFVMREGRWGKDVVFFSNEPFLLTLLLLWRSVFRFQYRVCSDWHMIVDDWKSSYIARNADTHITTTEHLRKQVIELGTPPEKITTVYGGVKLLGEELADRARLGLPEDATLVGYVGLFKTLGQEKGIRTLIDSLRYLSKEVRIVAVGGTKEEIEEYQVYAKEKGVASHCIFVERVPEDEVLLYQKALDILVIPYPDKPHFRKYGFPMKTYEYMASGKPIIYSNLPIIAEVLEGYGVSFQADDPASLAVAIKKVHNGDTDDMVIRMKKYVQTLTWKDKAQDILNAIYE